MLPDRYDLKRILLENHLTIMDSSCMSISLESRTGSEIGSRQICRESVLLANPFTIKNGFRIKLPEPISQLRNSFPPNSPATSSSCRSVYNQRLVPAQTDGNRFQSSEMGSRHLGNNNHFLIKLLGTDFCWKLLRKKNEFLAICSGIAVVVQGETAFLQSFRLSFLVL